MAASLDGSNNPTSQETTRIARPPFDKPSADLILRSSDGVDFRVFKWILSDASQVFAGMFSLPTPPPEHIDVTSSSGHLVHQPPPPPVVPVTEDSDTLEALLRLCYPLSVVPDYAQFETLKPVVAAAHKYQVAHALRILEPRMKFFAAQQPVRVYAFATRYDLPDIARDAARNFLFAPDTLVSAPELADISGAAYHRLLMYHRQCTTHIVHELRTLSPSSFFPPTGTLWNWERCLEYRSGLQQRDTWGVYDCGGAAGNWFQRFYEGLMDILETHSLNIPESTSSRLISSTLQAAALCGYECNGAAHTDAQLKSFLTLVNEDVKRRIASAPVS